MERFIISPGVLVKMRGANWQEYLGKVPNFLSSTKVNTPSASSVFEDEMTMNYSEVFYYGN